MKLSCPFEPPTGSCRYSPLTQLGNYITRKEYWEEQENIPCAFPNTKRIQGPYFHLLQFHIFTVEGFEFISYLFIADYTWVQCFQIALNPFKYVFLPQKKSARIINIFVCINFVDLNTFKYHVSCTDGKISVRINIIIIFIFRFHRCSIQIVVFFL